MNNQKVTQGIEEIKQIISASYDGFWEEEQREYAHWLSGTGVDAGVAVSVLRDIVKKRETSNRFDRRRDKPSLAEVRKAYAARMAGGGTANVQEYAECAICDNGGRLYLVNMQTVSGRWCILTQMPRQDEMTSICEVSSIFCHCDRGRAFNRHFLSRYNDGKITARIHNDSADKNLHRSAMAWRDAVRLQDAVLQACSSMQKTSEVV